MKRWIFLRGLSREAIHWGDFAKVFQQIFPDDQILCCDTRGNGSERNLPAFLTIESSVRDLRSRTESFRDGSPVYLMTISLGSMLGLQWCDRYPKEVAGIVCLNTSVGGISPFYRRLKPHNYISLLKLVSGMNSREQAEAQLLGLTTNTYRNAPLTLSKWVTEFAKFESTPAYNSVAQLIAAMRFRLPTEKPNLPLLLLASKYDQFVDPRCSEDLATKWQTPLIKHPWGGHDLPLEDPEWICLQIQNWLKSTIE